MKDLLNNLKNWQKIGILVGFLAVIAIIVVAVISILNSEIKVKISFDTKTNIPSVELKNIRETLVNVIRNNTENFSESTTYLGVARDYSEVVNSGQTKADFIVDFDTIKESYAVEVTWPDPNDGSPNIVISCPVFDTKYPETPCETEVNSSSDVVSYLPYEGIMKSGEKYKIRGKYSDGKLYLEVSTNGDAVEAFDDAKKWVDSLPLKTRDFLYYVPNKQYIQVNHAETKDANVNKYLPYFVPNRYNVYPVADKNGQVESITAKISGCTEYQANPMEEAVKDYLKNKNINYPVNFEYCMD